MLARSVEVSEAPIYELKVVVHAVEHDVAWFYVPVHDAVAVSEVEGKQELKHVGSYLGVGQDFEHHGGVTVGVGHVLKH